MFRGVIEAVTENSVSGWVYSGEIQATGRTLLAFAGEECIGSGVVDIFRQDLLAAGLGDGRYGFNFGITCSPDNTAPVVVKFEASDAVLLPPDSILTSRAQRSDLISPDAYRLKFAQLSWLSEHGMVKPAEFILLRDLLSFGYCSRDALTGKKDLVASTDDALANYKALLTLAVQAHVEVWSVQAGNDLEKDIRALGRDSEHLPIIGLFAEESMKLKLHRSSHLRELEEGGPGPSAIVPVRLRSPRILFLDARIQIADLETGGSPRHLMIGRLSR